MSRDSIYSEPFPEPSCNPTMKDGTNPEMFFLCETSKRDPWNRRQPGLLFSSRPCHKGTRLVRVSSGVSWLACEKSSWVLSRNFMDSRDMGFESATFGESAFKGSNQNSFEWQSPDVLKMTQLTADIWHSSYEIYDGEAAKIRTNIERTWSNMCFHL